MNRKQAIEIGRTARLQRRALQVHGVTLEELRRLNDGLPLNARGSKGHKYQIQKAGAAKRGIEWCLTFPEWIGLWLDSGKWEQRGARRGCYCMARFGDAGPYRIGNVRIALVEANHAESRAKRNAHRGQGYSVMHKSAHKPFTARFQRKILGHFPTPEQAIAARNQAIADFVAAGGKLRGPFTRSLKHAGAQ